MNTTGLSGYIRRMKEYVELSLDEMHRALEEYACRLKGWKTAFAEVIVNAGGRDVTVKARIENTTKEPPVV
jgi:hypothetical protein